jgi:hypothetical protein
MAVTLNPRCSHRTQIVGCILILSAVLYGCCDWREIFPQEVQKEAPATVSSSACSDIKGEVLGNIIPNSSIYLYKISGTDLDVVLGTVRADEPLKTSTVNQSAGFCFTCVLPGKYAAAIPTTSYNGSVGAPLPYEFDCDNVSLRILFQGGDYHHMVGAFLVQESPAEPDPMCTENPLFCRKPTSHPYRNCSGVLRKKAQ